ncbi:Cache sensor-containing signal transduction histidine kinase [Arcobacter venerupis]|uniref:histidine kinase n=1 Tax=Arcobacter venerupis TaxID=1054033 RepID=A0AAE7BC38_9BACT|nr:cache domain-containing protein [Arcobacter venerupis]QKF67639.1 Cache sensor-containing signal transduction histidine kinase [Arcobacter venerupis]RWS49202.1 histidine kinase [Arcobacter venerupis]
MKIAKEEKLLKIIKFTPSIFVIIISLFVILFLYFENKKTFIEEKKEIEEKYVLEKKELIQEEVNRVYTFIEHLQKSTEQELKKNVKTRVYEAHAIATGIYNKYKDTKSKEEIFQLIKVAFNDIRFNDGRGYYFMDDVNGVKLSHPIDTSIEGNNFLNYTDVKGYKLFETIVKTIKDKTERFDEYYWYKPNSNKEIGKKISFYKYFEPLNIAIGSGEYFDDFERNIQKQALEYINLIKFDKAGYIFIIDKNKEYLNHFSKNLVGLNIDKMPNDVKEITLKLWQIGKSGDGYYTYIQNSKPYSNEAAKKTSYVKGYKDWNWVIGSGFYEDDIFQEILETKKRLDEKYENYIKNILIIGFVLIIMLLIISKYVSIYLENKFKEYKIELNKQQTILHQQSKMAAMGEMIANIAHQWRQPLSTITTASTGMVLQKEMGVLTDEFFFEASRKINSSAQHLSKTIDDFRNFFSPNKVKSKVYIGTLFETTLDLISAQFNAKDIKIIENIENIELITYENELVQALINILNNARDELIKLPNEFEKLIFIDVLKSDKDTILIYIKDNAGGIEDENIDKIFEPYFSTKHKSQGTGIGLYMTEEIITKHLDGQIFVKNKEFMYNDKSYRGAQFIIELSL